MKTKVGYFLFFILAIVFCFDLCFLVYKEINTNYRQIAIDSYNREHYPTVREYYNNDKNHIINNSALDSLVLPDSCFNIYTLLPQESSCLDYYSFEEFDFWGSSSELYRHQLSRIFGRKELIIEYPLNNKYCCLLLINIKLKKSIYILWQNRPDNFDQKNPLTDNYHVTWDVCKATDTIITNLPRTIIFTMYHDFKGVVIEKGMKQISIDNTVFRPNTKEFYENIELIF